MVFFICRAWAVPNNLEFAKVPLNFIANAGQFDPMVSFAVKSFGYTIFFSFDGVVFSADRFVEGKTVGLTIQLRFIGASSKPTIEGLRQSSTVVNYFLGNDPAKWYTNVPVYEAVIYRDLYPGIDLNFHGIGDRLKSEFVVKPGADPTLIRMAYSGTNELLLESGRLVVRTELGELVEEAPIAYQLIKGQHVYVEVHYKLFPDGRIGFAVGEYNPNYPLIIDPVLVLPFSSYLGWVAARTTWVTT